MSDPSPFMTMAAAQRVLESQHAAHMAALKKVERDLLDRIAAAEAKLASVTAELQSAMRLAPIAEAFSAFAAASLQRSGR